MKQSIVFAAALCSMMIVSLLSTSSRSARAQCDTTGNQNCESGEVCVWRDGDFSFADCFYDFLPGAKASDNDFNNNSPVWNQENRGPQCDQTNLTDTVSSAKNLSGNWIVFYRDSGFRNNPVCFGPNSKALNLEHINGHNFGDQFSSYRVVADRNACVAELYAWGSGTIVECTSSSGNCGP